MSNITVDNELHEFELETTTQYVQPLLQDLIESNMNKTKELNQNYLMFFVSEQFKDKIIHNLMMNLSYNQRIFWIVVGNLQLMFYDNFDVSLNRIILAVQQYLKDSGYPIIKEVI